MEYCRYLMDATVNLPFLVGSLLFTVGAYAGFLEVATLLKRQYYSRTKTVL